MRRVLPLLLLLLLLLNALPAGAARLRVATGEFPPYAGVNLPDNGLALHIVRRAFELAGHQVEFGFLPWSRAQAETLAGQWDASAHWGATPERRRDFLLSDNLYTEQWQLLHHRALALDWKTVEDLRPYRMGLTRDYTYTPEIWAAARSGVLRHESPPNDLSGLRMLLARRIDVLPLDRNVACDLLMANFGTADQAQLLLHPKLMTESFSTHVLFPPQLPRSRALMADFNRGLRELRSTGEYTKLVQGRVRCPAHWD